MEGTAKYYHFHFRVTFGEFLQKREGSRNDVTLHAADAQALGPNANLKGGSRFFILETGKVFRLQWKDVETLKMLMREISSTNNM